jgi:hypothetical protein
VLRTKEIVDPTDGDSGVVPFEDLRASRATELGPGTMDLNDIAGSRSEDAVSQRSPEPAANLQWSGDAPDPDTSRAPWRVYSTGSNRPVWLADYIAAIENAAGKKAKTDLLPPGGRCSQEIRRCRRLGRTVCVSTRDVDRGGHTLFVSWFREYFKV